MATFKCPLCGLEFTAETEDEAKKMLKEHMEEDHYSWGRSGFPPQRSVQ